MNVNSGAYMLRSGGRSSPVSSCRECESARHRSTVNSKIHALHRGMLTPFFPIQMDQLQFADLEPIKMLSLLISLQYISPLFTNNNTVYLTNARSTKGSGGT